jgi:proline iminopeptidase
VAVVFDKAPVRSTGLLAVGGDHEVYWEESGHADGIPAVYLHGGPGGTLGSGGYRTKFDPERLQLTNRFQSSPTATVAWPARRATLGSGW